MIIVDERGFIAPNLEQKGFQVFDFYDTHQVLDVTTFCKLPLQRRAEVLLVDTETLLQKPDLQENFKAVVNTFLGVIFFHQQSNQKAQAWVEDQAAFLTKIIGEYALPMPQLQWTMLSNQMQFLWSILQEQKDLQKKLSVFSQELDQLMQTAEAEVARAKLMHETLIPKRTDEIRGVEFLSKYAAGDGGGGEFYDLIQTPQTVYQVLVSSQSYLVSSALLGLLNQHKQKDFNPTAFLKDCQAEISTINSSKKKKSEVDVMVVELDLSHLILTVQGSGKIEFYSMGHGLIDLSSSYQLSRGEKIIVFSPGFLFNWKEVHPKQDVQDYLKDKKLSLKDLLPELFFKLKLEQESAFLKKDATVVMMEVKRHGMHQV